MSSDGFASSPSGSRRNFLFTGSARGGEQLAAAYTLVDKCLLLGGDPFRYLLDVITKLEGGWSLRQLSALVPWRWAAEQAAEQRPSRLGGGGLAAGGAVIAAQSGDAAPPRYKARHNGFTGGQQRQFRGWRRGR